MKKNKFMKGALLLSLIGFSGLVQAEKSSNDAILDALSAEADQTNMKEVTPVKPNEIEPDVKPSGDTNIDTLSEAVAKKLSGILGDSEESSEKETEEKLESLVSSALLDGVKMDDLRSAVSAAMSDLSAPEEETVAADNVDKASKSLTKLLGASAESKEDTTIDYVQAQQKEAEDYAASLKKSEPASKKEPVKVITASRPARVVLPETVTVIEGDSLYRIALRVYGDGYNYVRLYEANKDIIIDPNVVLIGQVLRVPR
ncbi:MAG: LysM peptidoglycan-binding domain-containing protein [Thiotrichaceae bacterium]